MRTSTVRHDHLRRLIDEFDEEKLLNSEWDEIPQIIRDIVNEIKHSCLIVPVTDKGNNEVEVMTAFTDMGDFGLLFTDMDEFRKVFPNFDQEARENPFEYYKEMYENTDLVGFVINISGEAMAITESLFKLIDSLPQCSFSDEKAYSSMELKGLRDSIDNESLEEFIKNPNNAGRYEELINEISKSTMLTLMISPEDLGEYADDGMICMKKTGPLGFLYVDRIGGKYATVFTSERKIASVDTPMNKYSQIVNFSQMTYFILNDDLDGLIINPGDESVLLTREVLREFYPLVEKTCNDERLNTAIMHMFLIEE